MTPSEYETLRLQTRVIAAETLLEWMSDLLGASYMKPQAAERLQTLDALRNKLSEYKDHYATMTLNHLSAAESDLQAAAFQEAFDDLSGKIVERMERLLR